MRDVDELTLTRCLRGASSTVSSVAFPCTALLASQHSFATAARFIPSWTSGFYLLEPFLCLLSVSRSPVFFFFNRKALLPRPADPAALHKARRAELSGTFIAQGDSDCMRPFANCMYSTLLVCCRSCTYVTRRTYARPSVRHAWVHALVLVKTIDTMWGLSVSFYT